MQNKEKNNTPNNIPVMGVLVVVIFFLVVAAISMASYMMGMNRASTTTNQAATDLVEPAIDAPTKQDAVQIPTTAPSDRNEQASDVKPEDTTTAPAAYVDQFAGVRTSYATDDSSRNFLVEYLNKNSMRVRIYDAKQNKITKQADINTLNDAELYSSGSLNGYIDFNPNTGDIYFATYKLSGECGMRVGNCIQDEYLNRTNIAKSDTVEVVLQSTDLAADRSVTFSHPLAHPKNPNKVYLQFTNKDGSTIGVVNIATKEVTQKLFTYSLQNDSEMLENIRLTSDGTRLIAITTQYGKDKASHSKVVMYDHSLATGKTTRKEIMQGLLFNGNSDYAVNHDGSKVAFIALDRQSPERLFVYDKNADRLDAFTLPSRAKSNTGIVWNRDDSRVYLSLNKQTAYFDLNLKKFTTIRAGIDNATFNMYVASDSVAGVSDYVLFIMENIRNNEKTADVYDVKSGKIMTGVPTYVGTVGLFTREMETF